MLSQIQQRAREITARDFAEIAASSSSIPKQHFPQLLERHLLRQPTASEVAIMTTLFGESGLQLDSWRQWLDGSTDCQDKRSSACVEQRSETGLTEGIGQTQAACEKNPSLSQDGQTAAEKQADAATMQEEAPSVEKERGTDQPLAAMVEQLEDTEDTNAELEAKMKGTEASGAEVEAEVKELEGKKAKREAKVKELSDRNAELAANEMLTLEWAADLPEGMFAEFESRAFNIPKGEHRATKLSQLRSLATLVKQVLEIRDLTDDNKHSDTHGKMITWPMVNMYIHRFCPRSAHDFAVCACAYDLGLFQVPHM